MRIGLFVSVIALGAVGCPAAPGDCAATGTCAAGTPCTTDAQCADGLCDFVDPDISTDRTCLDECDDGICPTGYVCRLRGATGYCRVDHFVLDAGPPVDVGPIDAPSVDGGMPVDAPSTPDAPAGACPSSGAMRVVACARCGMQSQRCSDALIWENVGACLGSGECDAATNETEATTMCGERQRICGADCTWGAWEQTVPDGECVPGTCTCYTLTSPRNYYCDSSCNRHPWPGCQPIIDPCPAP